MGGSLTGLLSGDTTMSMRPAWMKQSSKGDIPTVEDPPMLGVSETSIWDEQKYSRSFFIQARGRALKAKAYEVPEEMMTMSTGTRPKWKADKREKTPDNFRELRSEDMAQRDSGAVAESATNAALIEGESSRAP